jgi:cyclase
LSLIKEVARQVNIPFTVGGGISSEADAYNLLSAGADKISVNSAAVKDPALVSRLAKRFGSQCVVLATDAGMQPDGGWQVYVNGGRKNTGISALCWIEQAVQMGAGEILLTSINNDGGRKGFALSLLQAVTASVQVPIIASGGAGSLQHFADVFEQTGADAALAAGIFHEESITIPQVKQYLNEQNIPVRL